MVDGNTVSPASNGLVLNVTTVALSTTASGGTAEATDVQLANASIRPWFRESTWIHGFVALGCMFGVLLL